MHLRLNFLLLDNGRSPSSIKMESSDTVIDLKRLFIQLCRGHAQGVTEDEAQRVSLWKVGIDRRNPPTMPVTSPDGFNGTLLDDHCAELSNVFTFHPQSQFIHLLVRLPPPDAVTSEETPVSRLEAENHRLRLELENAELRRQLSQGAAAPCKAEEDTKKAVKQGRARVVSPSTVAKTPGEFKAEQEKGPIYNGRPVNFMPSPVVLYNKAFATLQDNLDNLDAIEPTPWMVQQASTLFDDASYLHYDDYARQESVSGKISRLFAGEKFESLHDGRITADQWAKIMTKGGKHAYFLAVGWKNELGVGGMDDYQLALTYRRLVAREEYDDIRRVSNCPAILLSLAGPFFRIQCAAFVDVVIAQPLTDWISLEMGMPGVEARIVRVARIFRALSKAVRTLKAEYAALVPAPLPRQARLFPSPQYLGLREEEIKPLVFTARLDHPADVPSDCAFGDALYRATYGGADVVVKFPRTYGADAHRLLAARGLAPALHLCCRVCGGLYMVVMDYVAGARTALDVGLPGTAKTDVREALHVLHEGGFVYGDLRGPNVLVVDRQAEPGTQKGAVLVDFDWAGRTGEVRYPPDIDVTDVRWAEGVQPRGVIEPKHDLEILGILERECPA